MACLFMGFVVLMGHASVDDHLIVGKGAVAIVKAQLASSSFTVDPGTISTRREWCSVRTVNPVNDKKYAARLQE